MRKYDISPAFQRLRENRSSRFQRDFILFDYFNRTLLNIERVFGCLSRGNQCFSKRSTRTTLLRPWSTAWIRTPCSSLLCITLSWWSRFVRVFFFHLCASTIAKQVFFTCSGAKSLASFFKLWRKPSSIDMQTAWMVLILQGFTILKHVLLLNFLMLRFWDILLHSEFLGLNLYLFLWTKLLEQCVTSGLHSESLPFANFLGWRQKISALFEIVACCLQTKTFLK